MYAKLCADLKMLDNNLLKLDCSMLDNNDMLRAAIEKRAILDKRNIPFQDKWEGYKDIKGRVRITTNISIYT